MRAGTLLVSGGTLETAWWGPGPADAPTIVLLHEGLGCVALWRDVPKRLAEATGWGVFAYSRFGYGQSGPVMLPRPVTYMHHEAQFVLPEVLAAAGIRTAALVGHSDGGSIAAIYAGRTNTSWAGLSRPPTTLTNVTTEDVDGRDMPGHDGGAETDGRPAPRLTALVTIAAHFFVEDLNIASIQQIKTAYETTDMRARMARYHRDADMAFRGWNDAWLDPGFRDFDITGCLPDIKAPVLALQGEDDPYGSIEQLHVFRRHARAPFTATLIPGAKHAPHLEAKAATLSAITRFILENRAT